MGSFCSLGTEKERPKRITSYNNIDDIRFNAGLFIQEHKDTFLSIYSLSPLPIAYGSYGEIRICEHLRSKEKRAVKMIEKSCLSKSLIQNRTVLQEVDILRSLDHPNILKVFEYFEDLKYYYIVMEYCPYGDLLDELLKRVIFDETLASKIMGQIFAGVNYIHSRSIIHRDLKLENILICSNQNEIKVKIIDFNISALNTGKKLSKFTGTFHYMAPEVINQCYDEKCDLWACGVIMYILLTGEFPFTGNTREEIFENILTGKFGHKNSPFAQLSLSCKDILSNLLNTNPASRFSARDSLSHSWIESNYFDRSDQNFLQRTLTRMLTITKKPKLREMFETFLLSQVQKKHENFKSVEKVFFELDIDKNGVISIQELVNKFKNNMSEEQAREEAERILRIVDNDGSGEIDYTEFLRASMEEESYVSKENLKKAFYYFDKNCSGTIEKNELMSWLTDGAIIPMEVVEQLIEEADKNGDGVIDLEEFENLLLDRIAKTEEPSLSVSFEDEELSD